MRHQPVPPGPGDPTRHRVPARSSRRSSPVFGLLLAAFVSALAVTAVACSSNNQTTATQSSATTPAATTPTATAQASSTSAVAGDLSGTWSGKYSGDYHGTFTLTWQQSGSKLSGTIELPSLGGSLPVNGTLEGDTISFGTVGSQEITYSGSVSGSSMSGTWQLGGGAGGGSWSASKTS